MNRFFGGAGNTTYNPYIRPGSLTYPATTVANYQNAQPMQPMQSSFIPNQTNMLWVDSEDQISLVPTGRGWQQWFGNKNEQILYVRDTDANGVTQPIVKLRYELIEDPVATKQDTQIVPTYDGPSREEFNKLSDSVNLMAEKLADLLK